MIKRREFSALSMGALAVSGLGLGLASGAASAQPREGAQFKKLDQRQPVDAPGKVEVVEFFRYSCPHCASFEPMLGAWVAKLPKDVAFKRVPVSFADEKGMLQRLYYALESMGVLEKLHGRVFIAYHAERVPMNTPDQIADWVAKQGVDRAKFMDQYNSFSVATKASRASQLQNNFRLEGVPTMGFGGRYISDGGMAGGMPQLLAVGDYLIAELRAGRL